MGTHLWGWKTPHRIPSRPAQGRGFWGGGPHGGPPRVPKGGSGGPPGLRRGGSWGAPGGSGDPPWRPPGDPWGGTPEPWGFRGAWGAQKGPLGGSVDAIPTAYKSASARLVQTTTSGWGWSGGPKMAKNGQNGQKWPKMAKMAKWPILGGIVSIFAGIPGTPLRSRTRAGHFLRYPSLTVVYRGGARTPLQRTRCARGTPSQTPD